MTSRTMKNNKNEDLKLIKYKLKWKFGTGRMSKMTEKLENICSPSSGVSTRKNFRLKNQKLGQ